MKVFHCDHCNQPVFFENTTCVVCQHVLAYLPDLCAIGSLEPIERRSATSPLPAAKDRSYRLCRNYTDLGVCNGPLPRTKACKNCVERAGSPASFQVRFKRGRSPRGVVSVGGGQAAVAL